VPRLAAVSLSRLQYFQEEGGLFALLAELEGSLFTTHGGSDLIIHGRPDPVPLLDFIVEVGDCRHAVRRDTHLAWVLVCCSVLLAPYSTVRSEMLPAQPGDYQQCKPVVQASKWAHPGSSAREHNNEAKRLGALPGAACERSIGDLAVTTSHCHSGK